MPPSDQRFSSSTSLGAEIQLDLEPVGFAKRILPRTLGLAWKHRRFVRSMTSHLPKEWPLGDRLVAWLVPSLERDVIFYHAGRGLSMSAQFQERHLARLDEDIYELLKERIKRERH